MALGFLGHSKLHDACLKTILEILLVTWPSYSFSFRLLHYYCDTCLELQSPCLWILERKWPRFPCRSWFDSALRNTDSRLFWHEHYHDSQILSWDSSLVKISGATNSSGQVSQISWLFHYFARIGCNHIRSLHLPENFLRR